MRLTGKAKTCVWRWQERFMVAGAAGLLRDKSRPSRIPPLGAQVAERVVTLTLGDPPGEITHWNSAAMAEAAGISVGSLQRIWRVHSLQPHRMRQFKLSSDPLFAAKVRDIVRLYVDPPAHAVVLSVDEKSQIQALDRTEPGLPLKKGRSGTMTHDDKRNGTNHPVRRPERAGGRGHRPLHAAPPASGVHPLPQSHSSRGAGWQTGPHHPRQRRRAQAPKRGQMAGAAPPVHLPFHAHLGLVDQRRRGLLRQADQARREARRVSFPRVVAGRHQPLPCRGKRKSETLPLDQ
jgi:hypothetical protein